MNAQDMLATLRSEFASIVLGVVISAFGLSALAGHLARPRSRDRLLLWFGLFAGLYGVRLLLYTRTAHLLLELSPRLSEYTRSSISYVIVIPALLFGEILYGKGWKSCFRWWIWFQAAYAFLAIVLSIVLHDPFVAPDPGVILLVVMPVILGLCHVQGYRPPPVAEGRILAVGGLTFIVSVLNEHLAQAGLLPWRWRAEPVAFFVFICCLGYVAVRRFFIAEQKLAVIQREMETARQIQSSILPREMPRTRGLDVCVRYIPMAAVAGDFYDFLPLDDWRLGVLVADVSGHGVPAALVASMIKIAVRSQMSAHSDPAQVISGLNQVLCRELQGPFATAGYLFLDLEKKTAQYAGAGHPPLLLRRKTAGTLQDVQENGLLLGVDSSEHYSSVQFGIQAGDRIIMCTDGILEAQNSTRGFFGDERFRELIAARDHLPAENLADSILEDLARWSGRASGEGQEDDLTLLVLDIEPGEGTRT